MKFRQYPAVSDSGVSRNRSSERPQEMPETVSVQGFFSGIELRSVADSFGTAPHIHDTYSIVVVTKGSKIIRAGRTAETASAGAVLLHEPFQVHETHSLSHNGYSFKHLGIAELTQVSRVHVSRVFKQHVGLAPHEYLLQLRVASAKTKLAEGM